MTSDVFPTPEAAMMVGYPPGVCRVLAVAVEGRDGFVVLDTGPAGRPYLYGGTVERVEGGWVGGSDGNGGAIGWTHTGPEEDIGVLAVWDEAPPDADMVRVAWRGKLHEAPVRNGAFLLTWFREPYPGDDSWPTVVEFRVNGRWPSRRN